MVLLNISTGYVVGDFRAIIPEPVVIQEPVVVEFAVLASVLMTLWSVVCGLVVMWSMGSVPR